MRLLHGAGAVRALFDDPSLVSHAGLAPVMRLAECCGLPDIVRERLHVPTDKGSNAAGKVTTVVAGMLTGADSIDDLEVVRHGGVPLLFAGVYASSTLGSFLRAFSHGHVRQLQAVSREFLIRLAGRTPLLPSADAVTFIDVDSLLRRVYGKQKQGAGFGHAKVGGYKVLLRGLHPLIATLSTPDAAPVIAATQLRAGNAASARGAASLVAEAITTAKAVLATQSPPTMGEIVLRADSAFYSRKVIRACRRAGVRFSVTIRVDKKVRAAIAAISDHAWVEIEYPQPVWDDDQQRFVSRAQIAETCYTAFQGTRDEVSKQATSLTITDLAGEAPCCPPIAEHRIPGAVANQLAPAFKALGDPVRLQLMSMIASAPDGESCVCDLTPDFELSGPTISHHLKTLREAGLVTAERRGTWVYYRAQTVLLRQLAALLTVGP